jgi:glycosyltransferase involved in cell wall biosynthesis
VKDPISEPLISTVIPTYRRPHLLRRAIRSVLNQTYPHFQVLVFDNASGDETVSVVRELALGDPRVKYHCQPENIGIYPNFIFGVEKVTTPFFSILSDDDVLLPEFYDEAMRGFARYPDAVMSITATLRVVGDHTVFGAPILGWKPGYYPPPEGMLTMLRQGNPEWTGAVLRREIWDKVNGLDLSIGPSNDLDFELQIGAHYPIVVSAKPGAIFVRHISSASGGGKVELTWPGWLRMLDKITSDQGIPERARLEADRLVRSEIRYRLFVTHGIASVAFRRWDDASLAAQILSDHFESRSRALILKGLVSAAQRLGWLADLLAYAGKLRWKVKNWKVQRRYGAMVRAQLE